MAIAPIQGMLKKHLLTNLSFGLGLGLVGGYAYWYGVHTKQVAIRDAFYAKYATQKTEESA